MPKASRHILAARYAKALFALAVEKKAAEAVITDLESLSVGFEEGEGLSLLAKNPLLSRKQAEKIVVQALQKARSHELVIAFVKTLACNRRLGLLPYITQAFAHLLQEKKDIIDVQVITATELSKKQKDEITKVLTKALGKKIVLQEKIDSTLLGGAVFGIGSKMLDGSLKGRIERMRVLGRAAVASL